MARNPVSGHIPSARYLEANNSDPKMEDTFFIGVSRVDSENEIFKRKFLFSGRVLGGFWQILVSARPKGGP